MKPLLNSFFLLALVLPGSLSANPIGPQVKHGAVDFKQQGDTLTITNSPGAVIHWQDFSIGRHETTTFIQQNSNSAVLNRMTGGTPSTILGNLNSNGKVYLINPNGILFGKDARVDVQGLVASSLNISDTDFHQDRQRFSGSGNEGQISNLGKINTTSGGQVLLIAPNVKNNGIITSSRGEIILAAGKTVELASTDNPALRVQVTAPNNEALNLGRLIAESGNIGIYAGLTRQSGVINASSAINKGGKIYLTGQRTQVTAGSQTLANGKTKGGSIRVMADETLTVKGKLQANGGGGFIETSAPTLDIHTTEVQAQGGEWLIDPTDIYIDNNSCSGTNCLTANNISATLSGGTDVTIQTSGAGADEGIITVEGDINHSGSNTATLTLMAHDNIHLLGNFEATGAGALNVALIPDSDNSGLGYVRPFGANFDLNGGLLDVTQGSADLRVKFSYGGFTLANNSSAHIGSLWWTDGYITNNGEITITSSLDLETSTTVEYYGNGDLIFGPSATYTTPTTAATPSVYNTGSIYNHGTLTLLDDAFITQRPIINESNGVIQIGQSGSGITTTFSQDLSNNGSLEVLSNATFSASLYQNAGTLHLADSAATLSVGSLALNGGALTGNGTISGDVTVNGGTIAPGNSPGTINITGDLTLTAGSNLDMEIDGTSATDYDVINVSGTATLGGTLTLLNNTGFTYPDGSLYTLINAGSVVGSFASLVSPSGYQFTIIYGGTSVSVQSMTAITTADGHSYRTWEESFVTPDTPPMPWFDAAFRPRRGENGDDRFALFDEQLGSYFHLRPDSVAPESRLFCFTQVSVEETED